MLEAAFFVFGRYCHRVFLQNLYVGFGLIVL